MPAQEQEVGTGVLLDAGPRVSMRGRTDRRAWDGRIRLSAGRPHRGGAETPSPLFNEPSVPIPSEITALTGTDGMVTGQRDRRASVERLRLSERGFCHRAQQRLDRKFAERAGRSSKKGPGCGATESNGVGTVRRSELGCLTENACRSQDRKLRDEECRHAGAEIEAATPLEGLAKRLLGAKLRRGFQVEAFLPLAICQPACGYEHHVMLQKKICRVPREE